MSVLAPSAAPKVRSFSISSSEKGQRVQHVRDELSSRGLDALVLFHPQRIGYLTNFVFVSTERLATYYLRDLASLIV